MRAWLNIIGIGEDGMTGVSPAARTLVETAEVIIGGDRHHDLTVNIKAQRLAWPSPFDAMINVIRAQKGKRVVVLVTGDPLWFSVGARIARAIPPEEISFFPQLSAFQWAASRLGWSLADSECLTAHGRPVENVVPFIQPGARLLILTTGADTPALVARLLTERGYGESKITVFGALGGPREQRFDGIAQTWSETVPDFNTLAVECVAGIDAQLTSRLAGLPDNLFQHDGKMTKSEVRSITLAKLMPMRGALLWDIGCGSGSVAIEWMRAAPDALAIGLEPRADRRVLAAQNAMALGAPRLQLLDATVPDGLEGLAPPDAVFFGGGLSLEAIELTWAKLKPRGRLVANAVTLESESILLQLFAKMGGDLTRIAIQRADPVGHLTGWRPLMPVTQWSLVKR
ncbi:MAG: precorrin-6y C5,15-methyltransferase (decarboxylating) subunit CbiE [Deltaproteobacteria bacterium]